MFLEICMHMCDDGGAKLVSMWRFYAIKEETVKTSSKWVREGKTRNRVRQTEKETTMVSKAHAKSLFSRVMQDLGKRARFCLHLPFNYNRSWHISFSPSFLFDREDRPAFDSLNTFIQLHVKFWATLNPLLWKCPAIQICSLLEHDVYLNCLSFCQVRQTKEERILSIFMSILVDS